MSTINGGWRSPDIVRDGLVLYLDAGTSNSYNRYSNTGVWKDVNGNGTSGSLINGPTFSNDVGGSIQFDGTDDYVASIDASTYTDLTIDMWIYDSRALIQRDILTYNDVEGASYTFGGSIAAFRTDANGIAARRFSSGTPPASSWYRFCYVKNGNLYINTTSYSGTGTDRSYGILKFGNTRAQVGRYLQGNIAEIKVYNRALQDFEILQNYNATKTRFGL